MTRLSVVVMAHPTRRDYAERLRRQLGRGVRVVYDPEPDAERNPWRTARQAWSTAYNASEAADYGLVVQEDIEPCDRFLFHAKRALTAKPGRIVSFYLGDLPTPTAIGALIAAARGGSWVQGHPASWVPTLALAIPRHLIPTLVEFDDGTQPVADDEVLGRWAREHGLPWYCTVPSLVDHDDDAPSLMRDPYATGTRRASQLAVDPAVIDFTLD